MISSIRNEQYYQYQNIGSYKTDNESNTYSASVTTQSLESDDELQLLPPRPVSEEDYTSSDHMEMMRGGKPAPEMTELSSASEVDEETLEEYDVDGDGVLSAEEYAAMMEDKRSEALESSKASPRSQTMESTRKGARESAEIAFTRGTAGMAGIASAKAKERATPAKTLKKENITAGKDNSNKLYLARGGG